METPPANSRSERQSMQYGTAFPSTPAFDQSLVGPRARALENAGFDYITLSGHLLSARSGRYEGRPDSQYALPYHDPFILFSYIAALTTRIHMISSIVILPLRETAAVARQAAELASLSNGRFEMGVGLSWQEAEYRAVGQNLHERGARLAEQVEVLRLYWSQPHVTFKGRFHDIDDLGLGILPARPIPIWFGTTFNDASMKRAAALGDGWMPIADPTGSMPQFQTYMTQAGRDPGSMRVMGRLVAGEDGSEAWVAEGKRLQSLGVTHITIDPPLGLDVEKGIERVAAAREILRKAVL
ncbi:TIGR03619 family F420-dependent LLM class oxidoreductase [Novosphingobium sp.]|uniref:TIGR03619 family F420-dependent LLM class oxidoreductase n=1 Tax=Novosphingobium sp. TaxID=1874826 RepID=UPI002FDA6865